jgi:hypothetical protein
MYIFQLQINFEAGDILLRLSTVVDSENLQSDCTKLIS